MDEYLTGLTAKITAALAVRPEVSITHPAELRILSFMSEAELQKFATDHDWRVVSRVGRRQIEFYHDTRAVYRPL